MHPILDQLIHQPKTKRWFGILALLEEFRPVTSQGLADQVHCTKRTIQSDIKEIKDYFRHTITLIGDDEGYHFSFQNPSMYLQKKQALLENEPLFRLIDQLLDGTRRTNQQWASELCLSTASFGRIKHDLVQWLETQYGVRLVLIDNQLAGEEASIRQLMYDFYFTLPMLPSYLSQKVEQLHSNELSKPTSYWSIDSIRLNQWYKVFAKRINQGQYLPLDTTIPQVKQKLALELDNLSGNTVPIPEKAALFLLSLKEEQFLNPLRQKVVLQQFSSDVQSRYFARSFEGMISHFFERMVFLMKTCFQLPRFIDEETQVYEQTEEARYLEQLKKNYFRMKKKIEKSIVLYYQLSGTLALQEWIKMNIREHLTHAGFALLEDVQNAGFTRQLVITNEQHYEKGRTVVALSEVPEKGEIQEALEKINL